MNFWEEIIRICLNHGWLEKDPFMNYDSKFDEVTENIS